MNWHANAADLLRRTGAAAPAAVRLVLDALAPGALAFVALAGECLACAAGAGPFPDASAADLDRAAEVLDLLVGDLHSLLLQVAELTDLPDRAARVVVRSLAADARCRAAARRLGRLAAASDRLAGQVRRAMAGRPVEAVAAAVRQVAETPGVADLVEELCTAETAPDEMLERIEVFTRAARLQAEGRFAEASDMPGVTLPPGEWFVADESQPQIGFDRMEGPPTEIRPDRLYQLHVSRTATNDQLTGLGRSPIGAALYALVMSGCTRLTDAALVHLAGMTGLRVLDLSFWDRLSDAGLAHASALTELRVLNLSRAGNVTDAGLVHLAGLRRMRSLDLTGCERLTDAGLAYVERLTDLRSLDLSFCVRLTDAGLARLGALSRLGSLALDGCGRLTDAGLAHLHGLAGLRSLTLGRCEGLSDEGVEALRTALPECEVWG